MHRRARLGHFRALALLLSFAFLPGAVDSSEAATKRSRSKASVSKSSAGTKRTVKRSRSSPKRRYSASRSRARRARIARARAAAYARELRDLQTPRFRALASGEMVPDLLAEAAIVYNPVTQQVLWEENSQDERSIASITKVMTAVVYLEHSPDLTQRLTVHPSDVRGASTTYLRANEEVSAGDLLNLLLIGSDNLAARTLARHSPFGPAGFIDRMNQKAQELGLQRTHYTDPSGLNAENVSSAFDMARLIAFAAGDDRVGQIMRISETSIVTSRRTLRVRNTNKLLGDFEVRGGKTGFIRKSGYCLATLLQAPGGGDPVAVVVLGARSNAARFIETKHLFNWLASRTTGLLDRTTSRTPDAIPQ